MTKNRRRLLADIIHVEVSIRTPDKEKADAVVARLSSEKINSKLAGTGLSFSVTVLRPGSICEIDSDCMNGESPNLTDSSADINQNLGSRSLAVIIAIPIAGAVVVLWIIAYIWRRRCSLHAAPRSDEQRADCSSLMEAGFLRIAGTHFKDAKDRYRLTNAAKHLIQRWRLKSMATPFLTWAEKTAESKKMKATALKVVKRMMNGCMVLAFERWKECTVELKEIKNKALKVVRRMMNGCMVLTFERWKTWASQEKELKTKVLKVVHRIMNGCMVLAFERWKTCAAKEKELKAKALKVLHLMMNGCMVLAFEKWACTAEEMQRLKSAANLVVQHWRLKSMATPFLTWAEKTAENMKMKATALKVVKRMVNACMVLAFERWKECAAESKEIKNKALKVVRRIMHGSLVSALQTWMQPVKDARIRKRQQELAAAQEAAEARRKRIHDLHMETCGLKMMKKAGTERQGLADEEGENGERVVSTPVQAQYLKISSRQTPAPQDTNTNAAQWRPTASEREEFALDSLQTEHKAARAQIEQVREQGAQGKSASPWPESAPHVSSLMLALQRREQSAMFYASRARGPGDSTFGHAE
jgi:hypothetical protein